MKIDRQVYRIKIDTQFENKNGIPQDPNDETIFHSALFN